MAGFNRFSSFVTVFLLLQNVFSSEYTYGAGALSEEDSTVNSVKYLPPGKSLRQTICMNGIWDFKSNADTFWTKIPVPGSYTGVRQMWGGEVWDCWDYPVRWQDKGGTYKRTFVVPGYMKGKTITFRYDGIAHHAKLFVNDSFVGESFDAYVPFEWDITKYLKDGENEIKIEITDEPNRLFSDKKTYLKGIWRDTWLNAYNSLYAGSDAFVTTSVAKKTINIETPVINRNNKAADFFVRYFVSDADNNVVLTFNGGWHKEKGNDTLVVKASSAWADPHLWFTHDPYLYHLHTVVYDKDMRPVDHQKIRFGFREITWKGPHLYLNGRELFLHGHGGHSQGDLQGTREYYEAWLGGLKKRGINFMRLHNDPKHIYLYEVADEIGFLLEGEPAFHFEVPKDKEFAKKHLGDMVKNLRNHPSIIIWSVSNELRWRGGGEQPYLIDHVKTLDTSRPVFSSDFSLESTYGDLLGHHYNPKTVFDEWQKYGPDKPMIWDETGSVWQHDRPLNNGTAGYEVSSQDYATGLWYDGYEQILTDLEGSIHGKMMNGELYRPNAWVPWDISYVFFRFQPVNKGRVMKLHYKNYDTPGIKIAMIKPDASTVNIWDKTLPVMEPNPGLYIFAKHLPQVRFLEKEAPRAYFSGEKIKRTGKLFYEDLRLVDTIACKVESPEGLVYSDIRVPFNIKPGEIRDDVSLDFLMPVVQKPERVKLVREFRHKGIPGYRNEVDAVVYPDITHWGLPGAGKLNVAVCDSSGIIKMLLDKTGIKYRTLKSVDEVKYPGTQLLLSRGEFDLSGKTQKFIEEGGRWIVFAGNETSGDALERVSFMVEKFNGETRDVTEKTPFTSASTGLEWYALSSSPDKVSLTKNTLTEQYNKISLNMGSGKDVVLYTLFKKNGKEFNVSRLDKGSIILRYDNFVPRNKKDGKEYAKSVRVLLMDAGGKWFVSAKKLNLDKKRYDEKIDLSDLTWEPASLDDKFSQKDEKAAPDFSSVKGAGFVFNPEKSAGKSMAIPKVEFHGENPPSARVALNGALPVILKDVTQAQLTRWRGGSANAILYPEPGRYNYRNILLGNKDGIGSALFGVFAGQGVALVTSLNILNALEREPAAGAMLHNMVCFAAGYAPSAAPAKTSLWAGEKLTSMLSGLNLVADKNGSLKGCNTLIVDGSDGAVVEKVSANVDEIKRFVRNGGRVWIQNVTESSLPVFQKLVAEGLQLTDPFRGVRNYCVKAAVSWTLRNTPKTPVEYYDNILIPQPFEANYDPLLTGLANYDLSWNGKEMFDKGIEVKGMDPVDPTGRATILVSNWGIDWNQPALFGEYIHEARDWQRATWFINRDPVLLKVKSGSGYFLLSQLDFSAGGEKGERILTQLLTGMDCSVGQETYLPPENVVFDFAANTGQAERIARYKPLLKPARRVYYGESPELTGLIFPSGSSGKKELATVFLIGDPLLSKTFGTVQKTLKGEYDVHWNKEKVLTTADVLKDLDKMLGDKEWKTIQLSVGMGDVKLTNGKNTVSIGQFRQNLEQIVRKLKKTNAKLYWTTLLPVPAGDKDYKPGDIEKYNAAALEVMDKYRVYTNDLYDFVLKQLPGFRTGQKLVLSPEDIEVIGRQIADGIKHFGAQF